MNLIFNKITLKNFQSYKDAEFNLKDQGFCLISGENHCVKDNAKSNGSGKSTIFSALCYVLTGETLSGLKTNLKNLNLPDETDCFVKLDFNVDSDHYIITRFHKPKSDLKIIKNDEDISGKTFTDSSKILEDTLPDITKELIASTILLGQGNINKFSMLSPVNRKTLLEQLTKSDFMIEDIKIRVAERKQLIENQITELSTSITTNSTSAKNYTDQLNIIKSELKKAVKPDFDSEITKLTEEKTNLIKEITEISNKTSELSKSLDKSDEELANLNFEKTQKIMSLNESYTNSISDLKAQQTTLIYKRDTLIHEINHIKSIKDVCPTCGQKLVGVIKKDTKEEEKQVEDLENQLRTLSSDLTEKAKRKTTYQKEIDEEYNPKLNSARETSKNFKNDIKEHTDKKDLLDKQLRQVELNLSRLNYDKLNWDNKIEELNTKIKTYQDKIKAFEEKTKLDTNEKLVADNHLGVIKQIETLIKRDFRSYLLKDIISYINQKAKEYCEIVFNTRDIELAIDGNNLNLSYYNKNFDNLSGGEKQRVDIIIQFAIRDLLQNYLNYNSNIIVLDEIFDALDQTSTERVLDLINTKLTNVESVFIISHHSAELGLSYDTEINISKNADGISEVL